MYLQCEPKSARLKLLRYYISWRTCVIENYLDYCPNIYTYFGLFIWITVWNYIIVLSIVVFTVLLLYCFLANKHDDDDDENKQTNAALMRLVDLVKTNHASQHAG